MGMSKQDWRDLISFTKDEIKKEKKVPTSTVRDNLIKNYNLHHLERDLDHSYMELKEFPEEPKSYKLV